MFLTTQVPALDVRTAVEMYTVVDGACSGVVEGRVLASLALEKK